MSVEKLDRKITVANTLSYFLQPPNTGTEKDRGEIQPPSGKTRGSVAYTDPRQRNGAEETPSPPLPASA